jgi:Phospholipase_D-nuclease N-terminal
VPVAATTSLSGVAIAAIVVVGLVELGLMIYALIDLTRRPHVLGGRQWVWAIVIVVFGMVGPIVYLAVARVPAPAAEPEAPAATDRVSAAADLLYGARPDPTPPPAARETPRPDDGRPQ